VNDAQDLSEKMAQVWSEGMPGPDRDLEERARASLAERMRCFGRAFAGVAAETAARG